jgi:tRNA-dihydrouridine synthase A
MLKKPKTPIKQGVSSAARLSVAPMMDWTDRHCRYLHRLLSRHTLLYTEMVTAPALVYGDAERLLAYHAAEHPVALQLGGSDPVQLARATDIAGSFGFDEINLNIGCPSDRVQSGRFGACLMSEPGLVADCAAAMIEAAGPVPVTVKCRIGVDAQDPYVVLPDFLQTVSGAGVTSFAIHARKAWLQGLSPKQNRDVPPLDYAIIHQMKALFPHLEIIVNGGITSLDQALHHIDAGLDGAMIGRAAYHHPASVLAQADRRVFGADRQTSVHAVVQEMLPYIEAELAAGQRLNQITRHMLGLFAGRPGARIWRRTLSEKAHLPGAGPKVLQEALAKMPEPE